MIGRSEVNKMNNYDRYLAVRDKLRQVHEAAFAVNEFRKRSAYFPGAVEAFKPGEMTAEKQRLQAWEDDAGKDTRRAVAILLADYCNLKLELEDLLAQE